MLPFGNLPLDNILYFCKIKMLILMSLSFY